MQPCLYSPLPRDAYVIKDLPRCAVSVTNHINRGDTVWNLMWLSYPMLDKLPGAGPDWHLVYKTEPGLFPAIVTDVSLYDTLHEMLHEHPAKFAAWFAKEDHSAWAIYNVGGSCYNKSSQELLLGCAQLRRHLGYRDRKKEEDFSHVD